MSIADKQVLMTDLERKLGRILTVENSDAVMKMLAETLVSYDVIVADEDGICNDSEDLLSAFRDAKLIEGCSEKTIRRYMFTLRQMLRGTGVPVRKITVYHLRNYLMTLRNGGVSDATLGSYRYAYCSFFGWLQREKLIRDNPCENLKPIRFAKKVKLPFTDSDIERMKESCKTVRDKAIICFLLSTGCRINEVCELNRDEVDLQNLECVVHGKGNKERTVYLDDVTAMLLKRYFATRNDLYPALFVGMGTDRMKPNGIRKMLHNIERKTGVENIHPHRFRRTLATNLINRGMPIHEVSAILGHEKIDTTMTYIYIGKETVKNAYRKYA